MNIVTFCDVDDSLIEAKHSVEYFPSGSSGNAEIAILDINTIFDFEENKVAACKEKYVSVAIVEDESDYDAFKNFGIDAWIEKNQLSEINGLITLLEKRFLS
ncbi:MAG: hypothetical protein HRT41_10425 [Campylobacteraceae bacterium]|nr:hypothetical protein [Campylobacteraceae bacterium]